MRSSTARRAAVLGSTALLLFGPAAAIADADPAPGLPVELTLAIARDLKMTADQYLQRADLAQKLADFAHTARAQFPSSFAGAWLDEAGAPVVALADSPDAPTARSAAESAGFTVKPVAKTETALQNEMKAFDDWLRGQPVEIVSTVRGFAIDTVNNALAIRLTSVATGLQLPGFIDPQRVVVMPAAVGAEPITPVVDVAGELPRNALGAGDAYAAIGAHSSLRCSLGFNGTDAAGRPVNISAGHCDPDLANAGTPAASAVHELRALDVLGPKVGTFEETSLDNHDYSVIRISDDARARFENNIVRIPNAAPLFITGTATPVVGAPACKSGARTGFSCGVVNAVQQSVEVGTRHMNDSFSMNICALPGDSGGPVVTGTMALGVSSASSVADYPICEIPNLIGPFIGNEPQLFATPINVILAENPALRVRTN